MKTVRLLIVTIIALISFGYSLARAGTGVSDRIELYSLYSGEYSGRPSGAYVAYRARVAVPGAVELRLYFGKVLLGNSSYILITSLEDSSQQHLNAATISQWSNTTAYFNGNAVEVELHVAPGDSHVFFNLDSVLVGTSNMGSHGRDRTLTLTNNRTPSDDPAVGRLRDPANGNAEATAWIAANGYLVTAGHVAYLWSTKSNRSEQVLQFDVPNSQSDGTMVDPPAQDQYYIDQWIWYADSTTLTGDDWGVFSVNPNSETGLYPIQAQQSYYEVEQNDTCSALRVTGYGNAGANSLNDTQQSATGADAGSSGQLLRYSVHISSGSSGSPVIDEYTGKVVGIVDDFGNADYNVGTSMYNPGLWSYMQPKTQTATVTQLLSDNTTTDPNLSQWNGSSFAPLSPGSQITVTTSNPEVLKGDQSPDNGQKYNNWTLNGGPDYDVINPHKFLLMGTNFTSHLAPVYNATLESYLAETSSTGLPVSFKDPWLIDYNDPTYGMRNRGMSGAPYESVPIASNNLGTGSSHLGVFLNEVPLVNNPNSPYYSVATPATESYNGHAWAFVNWSGTSGTYFQNTTADTTAVVFGGDTSTVSANYKGIQLSDDPNAYIDNSQRKFIRTSNGWLSQVYTDFINGVEHAWIEHSTDGGSTWFLGNNGYPLDYNGITGSEPGSKDPSIDYYEDQSGNIVVATVFEEPNGSHYSIYMDTFVMTNGAYTTYIPQWIDDEPTNSYSVDANPNIVFGDGLGFIVTFEHSTSNVNGTRGIDCKAGFLGINGIITTNSLSSAYHVQGTDTYSQDASVYSNKSIVHGGIYCKIAYEEYYRSSSSQIYYSVIDFDNSPGYWEYVPGPVPVEISSGFGSPVNYGPSLIEMPDGSAQVCYITDLSGGYHDFNYVIYWRANYPNTYEEFGSDPYSVSLNLSGDATDPQRFAWSDYGGGGNNDWWGYISDGSTIVQETNNGGFGLMCR